MLGFRRKSAEAAAAAAEELKKKAEDERKQKYLALKVSVKGACHRWRRGVCAAKCVEFFCENSFDSVV